MAVTEGTSCGFVTAAPSADPDGTSTTIDNVALATEFTSPGPGYSVSKMGVYINGASEAANMQVGIYSDDHANGRPNALLASSGDLQKVRTQGGNLLPVLMSHGIV